MEVRLRPRIHHRGPPPVTLVASRLTISFERRDPVPKGIKKSVIEQLQLPSLDTEIRYPALSPEKPFNQCV